MLLFPALILIQSPKVGLAKSDLVTLKSVLETFHLDVGRYPTTKPSARKSALKGWRGPYATRIAVDPWGLPYRYTGRNRTFALVSYGADRRPGGTGSAVDLVVTD